MRTLRFTVAGLTAVTLLTTLSLGATSAVAATTVASCQSQIASLEKTSGTLTIATDNPGYTPWFVNNKPTNGKGYESAVGYAIAKTLGVAPTGTITTVTVANLADTDYFTIDDGSNTANVFEYDKAGNGVTTGRVAIDVHLLSTADEVRDATIVAINRQHTLGLLDITAVSGGAATVNLAHDFMGVGGNVAVTENVTNGGFAVTGMSTGVTPVSGLVQSGSVSWIAIGA